MCSCVCMYACRPPIHSCVLLCIVLGRQTMPGTQYAFRFLRWGIFLPMSEQCISEYSLRASYMFKCWFPLCSICRSLSSVTYSIHMYSICKLGYHMILICKCYIVLYVSILVHFWDIGPTYPYDTYVSYPCMMLYR